MPDVGGHVMKKKNPDFRFNRMRKSGKTEFFGVHIERAVITHLKTLLFVIFRFFSFFNMLSENQLSCYHILLKT